MGQPIVLVTNKIHDIGLAKLREVADVRYLDFKTTPADEFNAALTSCDGIVLRGTVKLNESVLGTCPNLKVIAKHGAGVEGVDMDAATRLGIIVANSGGANAAAVAEAAVMLMLATYRRLQSMREIVASSTYHAERNRLVFPDLSGKAVGLVGFGNIGRIVARICRGGFGNTVFVFDPAVDADQAAALGVTKVDRLEDMLPHVDVLSLHCPLVPATRNLIAAPQLRQMRQGAILVNTSRGGIVNEADLYQALSHGQLYGAGLDVFDSEPTTPDNPLLTLKTVVATPHCAGGSESSRVNAAVESVEGVLDVLIGHHAPRYILNKQVLGHTRAALTG